MPPKTKDKLTKIDANRYRLQTLAWLNPEWCSLWNKNNLWALKIFCLLINLLIIVIETSEYIGKAKNNNEKPSIKLVESKIAEKYTEPIK